MRVCIVGGSQEACDLFLCCTADEAVAVSLAILDSVAKMKNANESVATFGTATTLLLGVICGVDFYSSVGCKGRGLAKLARYLGGMGMLPSLA